MDLCRSSSVSGVDDLLATLKMDTRIQELQHKVITLQHTLRKMSARTDLKAARPPLEQTRSYFEDDSDDDDPHYSACEDYDSMDDDDDDYQSLDGKDDGDFGYDTFELVTPATCVRFMAITKITTGPRLVDVRRATAATSPTHSRSSSSSSSLPRSQGSSRASSCASLTSNTTYSSKRDSLGTSIADGTDLASLDPAAGPATGKSKPRSPVPAPAPAPSTVSSRLRSAIVDRRKAKAARRRGTVSRVLDRLVS